MSRMPRYVPFEPENEGDAGTPQAILLHKEGAYTRREGLDLLHLSQPDADDLSERGTFCSSGVGYGDYRRHRDQRGRRYLSGDLAMHQGLIIGTILLERPRDLGRYSGI